MQLGGQRTCSLTGLNRGSAATKAIKSVVESKAKANDIDGTADQIPLFSPKEHQRENQSNGYHLGKTGRVCQDAKGLSKASSELAAAAKSKDDAAVITKFKALGETCTSCHKAFRADKYAE
jgi:cytochrome c556